MRNFWVTIFLTLVLSAGAGGAESAFTLRLSELLREEILFTGPNCFNSALRALGLQNERRHILETEIGFLLDTFCERTPRLAGASLGVLRSPRDGTPLHGFVPLEGAAVFTKNGLSKRARHEIQSEEGMIALHASAARKVCPPSKPPGA